ncbi:DUF4153 domain-containing protein [Megalodesulfovibrio gigas]|uniref:DUF4153 domain-containing protein n=1 Tax=Megalodesulfovibrio gigas (strain ATCC 19364 / DSM 1382 / NCIMB 9332 / VKM B-1759) TaxID=1121448 RepID=T2G9A8_MEGG1|nr:DUF4153 domain-containing protein [Megalodesulfovibrio gigas]AGW12701.1 hypothetical protein DGI_0806 [Megalodesulfovibrio gigas DSM 1382 = ATCC 19364]
MQPPTHEAAHVTHLSLSIGLTQGVLAAVLVNMDPATPAMAATMAALFTLVIVPGLGLQHAWPAQRPTRLLLWLGLLTAILAGCAAWVCWDQPFGDAPELGRTNRLVSLLLWGTGGIWCGISLAGAAAETTPTPTDRLQWLRGVMHQSLAALAVVGVVYLVIAAGVALLNLVGLDLEDLIYSEEGTAFLIPVAWGLGMHGLRRRAAAHAGPAQLANAAGQLDARLARALLPVMAGLVGIFLVGLLIQGLEPLWNTRAATAILLGMQGLVVAAAMLAASTIQDDDAAGASPVPAVVRHSTDALLLALPVLAALAGHALWLRIAQHGLTPERLHATALCLLATLAALGLAGVVLRTRLRRRPWLEGAPVVAWAVAGTVVAISILFHTPLLDPLGLSARSQYARLTAGQVDTAAYRFDTLWWELGTEGRAMARQLQAELPELQARGVYSERQVSALQRRLEETIARGGALQHLPEIAVTDIEVIPPDAGASPELLAAVADTARLRPAHEGGTLAITPLQADNDAETEWLLIPSGDFWPVLLFDRHSNGTWEHMGDYSTSIPRATLLQAISAGTLQTQQPPYHDLTVDGRPVPLSRH